LGGGNWATRTSHQFVIVLAVGGKAICFYESKNRILNSLDPFLIAEWRNAIANEGISQTLDVKLTGNESMGRRRANWHLGAAWRVRAPLSRPPARRGQRSRPTDALINHAYQTLFPM